MGPKVWEGMEEAARLSPDSLSPPEWKGWCAWGGRKGGGEGCWSANGVKGTKTRLLPYHGGEQMGIGD